jgi:hypothetical protein
MYSVIALAYPINEEHGLLSYIAYLVVGGQFWLLVYDLTTILCV